MDNFRQSLEEASMHPEHAVDYNAFKHRLLLFSKRRTRLRQLLEESEDNSISSAQLERVLKGFAPLIHPGNTNQEDTLPPIQEIEMGKKRYIPPKTKELFESEFGADCESVNSGDSKKREADGLTKDGEDIDRRSMFKRNSSKFGQLLSFRKLPPAQRRWKESSIMTRISNLERREIMAFLAWEVEKAAMFYLSQWQPLSLKLVETNQNLQPFSVAVQELGKSILDLHHFCVVNIVTVRQVLIRYDAFCRAFEGTPLLQYYMKKMHLERIHDLSRMDEGSASLLDNTSSDGGQLCFRKIMFHDEVHALADSYLSMLLDQNPTLTHRFTVERQELDSILQSSKRAEDASAAGHHQDQNSLWDKVKYYFLLGLIKDRLGYEPSYLTGREKSLASEMNRLAEWKDRNHLAEPMKSTSKDDSDEPGGFSSLSAQNIFNLFMTLLAAFLYCMNYYIVEPSSASYAYALGADSTMSGMLIGMMPMASFTSAFLFSVWSNTNFRAPFLFSATLLVTGNAMYALAFNYDSFTMALVGRFLQGFGGPKCVVRRFMADTTAMNLRTSVNALFGLVVAAGSAFGPGSAIMLNKFNRVLLIPGTDYQLFLNGMTGPGYFMASMWTIFLLLLLFFFEEPDRTGLQEQMRKEGGDGGGGGDANQAISSKHSEADDTQSNAGAISMDGRNDDLRTIYSGATSLYRDMIGKSSGQDASCWSRTMGFFSLVTFPVRLCLGLLFAKVFVIEMLVSSTSALTGSRYGWRIEQVGTLGCMIGFTVIPLSVLVGRLSMSFQDRTLMLWLLGIGIAGLFLLIDLTDFLGTPTVRGYNEGDLWAVSPPRYIAGYFLVYISIQSFEGVIGSTLSKVIPTALASGTLNSGLLATWIDTLGHACGDFFISFVGSIDSRQLMNLLFVPGIVILAACLITVRRFYDVLAV